jgi:hypothetical protein
LVCGGETQAKEKILQYIQDAEIKGYPTEKLKTWLNWIESPQDVPHAKEGYIQPTPKKTFITEHPNKEHPQTQRWDNDIAELETYFASIELPTHPIKLNRYSTITDCSLFIESHFATVKENNGKRAFLPYLNRLKELKQFLNINSN